MMTRRQLGWRDIFLILTVLHSCRSLQVSIQQEEYEVAQGGDVTMTCNFIPAKPVANAFVLTWEAFPDNSDDPMISVGTYFVNNPVDITRAYEGRAFMEVNIGNQVSTLRLTKLTIQDSRRFQCSVLILGDEEGTPAATTFLLVLVPPSKPICNIEGTAEYWHNINLTCLSKEGSPKPVAEWKSYSVENILRNFPPKTTEKDGVLSLFNISREMSGFYICTSTNRIGSASCNLTLTVMPASMNIGSTIGIVVGVFAGVVVVGILIGCCCRKKNKGENAEGAPEAFYDRDAPETGEQYVDEKSNRETKQANQPEDKDVAPKSYYSTGTAGSNFEDERHSSSAGKERLDGKGSDADSGPYDQHNSTRGSRDHLDDKRNHYSGSRDRLDDQRDHYSGSRDRLDDQRGRSSGSRDRLDDQRDRYGGSRDRLDDQRDRYGGSRDRLDDQRDHYRGSRDRLDDQRDRHSGSRDRLNDEYRRSRDRLDYADD